MQDVTQEADAVKFIKLLGFRWCVHADRVNNKIVQEIISTVRMEGIRRRERPRKRWTDEAEEDLMIKGTKNGRTVTRDWKERGRTLLEAKVRRGLQCMRSRIRRGRRRSIDHTLVSSSTKRIITIYKN
jgi:hypothetical protein